MTTSGMVEEQNLERQIQKQMGCMTGFLHIFDRHHFFTGKRFYSVKRLPPPVIDTTSDSEKSSNSTESENLIPKQTPISEIRPPPPPPAAEPLPKPPPPLPIFELKGGNRSWKFSKESPRLSLDSRATTDAKGSLRSILSMANNSAGDIVDGGQSHRSSSVIARLMGLEPLLNSPRAQPEKQPELRRSASESRVSKDLFQSRFTSDGVVFNSKQLTQSHSAAVKDNADPRNYSDKNAPKAEANEGSNRGVWRAPPHRKNYFDSGDVFPEPKQTVTIYGEIEKRIKMRGINHTSKDLETLKEILEALQLKGLLHSKPPSQQNQVRRRSFVYDESPIVLMKPSRSPVSTPINRRIGNDCSPASVRNQPRGGRRTGETTPSVSPRRERFARSPIRTGRSPSPTSLSNSLARPKQSSVETQRRINESPENRKASPLHSPKVNARRTTGTDHTVNNRLPRSKKPTSEILLHHQKGNVSNGVVAEDESSSSSISGSSITTSTDTERSKADEYRDGRNVMERCDKLLRSISEIAATDTQPSPVSVLDSSFYKDESLTPSPVTTKRNIDFKDEPRELEEEIWSPLISPIRPKYMETSDDSDFIYISDILRATQYIPQDSDIFLVLEKQQYLRGHDTSKVVRLHRKLIFDTVYEILDRHKQLPPWKAVSSGNITMPSLEKIWSEFERIREREIGEDLFETICSVLKKDLAEDATNGWGDCTVEMSEAVLDIERLIFKDLICDSIGDLAWLASREALMLPMVPRRKLVF